MLRVPRTHHSEGSRGKLAPNVTTSGGLPGDLIVASVLSRALDSRPGPGEPRVPFMVAATSHEKALYLLVNLSSLAAEPGQR
jgi:hypothetical protein